MRLAQVAGLVVLVLSEAVSFGQGNDRFADATPLVGTSPSAVSHDRQASAEPGEPGHAGVPAVRSFWWKWTAPQSGVVNISAFGSSAPVSASPWDGYLRLAVYTGSALGDLREIGSNNGAGIEDYPGFPPFSDLPDSSFDLPVTAGTTYHIAVDGDSLASPGILALSLNDLPTITSGMTATGFRGRSFGYSITASNNPKTYAASGLPHGLILNPFNGLISGSPTELGTFMVSLSAENQAGIGTGTLTLTIVDPPAAAPPVISSGAAYRGFIGRSFNYRISARGNAKGFAATGLPPGLAIEGTTGRIVGVPSIVGSYPITISATNDVGTGTAIVTVTIESDTAIPTITSSAAVRTTIGSNFSYTISVATGSEKPHRYGAESLPPGLTFDMSNGSISGTPTTAGIYKIPISATNDAGKADAVLTITIDAPSAPPGAFHITSSATATGTIGKDFIYRIVAEGEASAFTAADLPPGLSINTQNGYITGVPRRSGTFRTLITASNGEQTVEATLQITITPITEIGSSTPAPIIVSSASAIGHVGRLFSYRVSANSNSSQNSYAAGGLPPGLGISSTSGIISGTPSAPGIYRADVSVSTPDLRAPGAVKTGTAIVTILIADAPASSVPVITGAASRSGAVGSSVGFSIPATSSPTSYEAIGLPAGLTLNPTSGFVSGSPTESGDFIVRVSATNSAGSGQGQFLFRIVPKEAPVMSSSPTATGTVGSQFSYNITASGSPQSYAADQLPPGLTFDGAAGRITGVPTSPGVYQVFISATNNVGTGQAVVTVKISNPSAPTFTTNLTASGTVDAYFYHSVYTSSQPSSISASGLPPGLLFDESARAITGTPTTAGVYPVSLSATNASGTGKAVVTMTITAKKPPVITSDAVASGSPGVPFSYRITASDGPTSYTTSGLPPGLVVNSSTGQITGTPGSTGTFSITISATNSGGTGAATLTIVIAPPVAQRPSISSSAGANGWINSPFSYTITASDSPTSFDATSLPPGLSVDSATGVISGRPNTSGVFSVPIMASNSVGATSGLLTITVDSFLSSSPVITSAASVNATVNELFSYTITTLPSESPVTFKASNLPAGLTLDSATGHISGIPTISEPRDVSISATNALGESLAKVRINVSPAITIPRITSSAAASAIQGVPFSYTLTIAGSFSGYSVTGLPPGLTHSAGARQISGTPLSAGSYPVDVTVYRIGGDSKTAVITIDVVPVDSARPVITSIASARAFAGNEFFYPLSASTPDASFSVSGLPDGLRYDPVSRAIVGVLTSFGYHAIPMTVWNAHGSSVATLSLSVESNSHIYRILSSAGVLGLVGSTFHHKVSSNAVGGPFTFTASTLPTGLSLNGTTGEISGTPLAAGSWAVTMTVLSGGQARAAALVTFYILPEAVTAPVFTSPASTRGYINSDFNYALVTSGKVRLLDVGSLPPGLQFDASSGVIYGRPTLAGRFNVPISASNAAGDGSNVLTVEILDTPPLPTITNKAVATATVGNTIASYKITATNMPDSFGASGLPPGLTLDTASGVISGTPSAPGIFPVNVSATNAGGTATAVVTFQVALGSVPGEFSSSAVVRGAIGARFNHSLSANNSPTAYSAENLPPGLVMNTSAGRIEGTPVATGVFQVPVTASNQAGSSTVVLTIEVAQALAPSLSSAATFSGTVGMLFQANLGNSSDSNVTYAAAGLPPGTSMGIRSGIIEGIPTSPGSYSVSVSATGEGGTSTLSVKIIILPLAEPLITSASGVVGMAGNSLSYSIVATDQPSIYAAEGLPPELQIDVFTGAITGVPTIPGSYKTSISAANAAGVGRAIVHFEVEAMGNAVPRITSAAAAPIATTDFFGRYTYPPDFRYQITATPSATSFGAEGLPQGLTLNPFTGLIAGVPTARGIFPVTISATNANGTGTAVLTIYADFAVPRIVSSANVLGALNQDLSHRISDPQIFGITNSSRPYFLPSIYSAEGLPPGLSLNTASGVITGRPTAVGAFPVAVSATNSSGTGTAVVTFIIRPSLPAAPRVLEFSSPDAMLVGTAGVPFASTLTTNGYPTSFEATDLPPGLSLNLKDAHLNGRPTKYCEIRGTPTVTGTFRVPISAIDASGSTSATVTIVIGNTPRTPVISSEASQSATVGRSFSYFLSLNSDGATSSSAAIYTVSNLPPGLILEPGTRMITGRPEAAGTYIVPISVSVGEATGNAVITIVVNPRSPAEVLPQIEGSAGALGFVGAPFETSFYVDNASQSPTLPTLPPGLTYAVLDGTVSNQTYKRVSIVGIPTEAGTFNVPIVATNSEGSAGASMTVRLVAPQVAAPVITRQPVHQTVPNGVQVTLNVGAIGTPGVEYQWIKDEVPISGATSATLTFDPAEIADSASYSVLVSNAAGTVRSDKVQLTVTTDYDSWRSSWFSPDEVASGLAAETADFNGDGVSNLMEYALARNPRGGGTGLPEVLRQGNRIRLQFIRDSRKPDITYTVEASDDLVKWDPIARSIEGGVTANLGGAGVISETGGALRSVTVEDAPNAADAPSRFLRLKVTKP